LANQLSKLFQMMALRMLVGTST